MWKALLSLVAAAAIIAGGVFLYRHRHVLFRPDFARTGGTVLAFAVDGDPPVDGLDETVAVLRRRFDPTRGQGVEIRATAAGEIEIMVPVTYKSDELVDRVKRLAGRRGSLEIRLVASVGEEDAALKATVAALKEPGAKDKVPPPEAAAPKAGVRLGGEAEYRYRWARLGPSEVKALRLEAMYLRGGSPDEAVVQQALTTGHAVNGLMMARQVLLAVRKDPAGGDPLFYVLTREEPDRPGITGKDVDRTWTTTETKFMRRPAVGIGFTPDGGAELFALTSRYATAGWDPYGKHRLAVILDGEAVSLPTLDTASRKELLASSEYTTAECEDVAFLIRGGALPVKLKPDPVRETTAGKR